MTDPNDPWKDEDIFGSGSTSSSVDLNDPKNAPPNSRWNEAAGKWDTIGPNSPDYDKTWGGYSTGDPNTDPWLKSVYQNQGWPAPVSAPGPTPTPTPAPTPVVKAPKDPSSAYQRSSAYQDLMARIQGATGSQQAVARDTLARKVFDDLQAAGHDVKWQNDELVVDGRRYVVGGIAEQTKYTPGEIGTDDIPQLSVDDWMGVAGQQTDVERMADDVMMDVLGDPFGGFDEEYADTLKGRAKDARTSGYLQEQDAISDMAHQLGQDPLSSPWAASEKLMSRRGRDLDLAGVNADIDIDVQDKRTAKQREAATMGEAAAGRRSQQRLAALSLASNNVFQQAALTGDRLALRESVKQAAAELGVQRDELMRDYIIAKQRELTQRTGMALGYDIDTQKLAQADEQFRLDLMMRLAQLEEASNQFGAQYDLDVADLEARLDNEAWRRANPV